MRKNIKTESGAPGSQRVRERCLQLLQQQPGLDLTALDDSLQAYSGLIQRWNPMASLVSSRDSEHLWLHIADSLSLLPAVRSCGGASPRLFDIGSGAGFPALPLALTCPELCFHMVERARKKAGFLELALGELGLLQRGAVEQGGFPQEVSLDAPEGWLVTARAIEKPGVVWKGLRELVRNGAVFLCQWPELPPESLSMFHVEQIADDWTRRSLRRGALHILRAR